MIQVKDLILSPIQKPLNFIASNGKILNLQLTKESKILFLLYLRKILHLKQNKIILDTPVPFFTEENIPEELSVKEFIHLFVNTLNIKYSHFSIALLEVLSKYKDKGFLLKHFIKEFNKKEKARFLTYLLLASRMPNIVFCDLDNFDNSYLKKLNKDLQDIAKNGSSVLILTDIIKFDNLGDFINYDII